MLQGKEKMIFHYLMEHKNQYHTSKEMADSLSCSDRTVRTYLKQLMDLSLEETGWFIEAKQGQGYRLVVVNQESYQTFCLAEDLLEQDLAAAGIEDRYNYLLNKLLFEQAHLYFDDLVEELFVSRSTLSADFKKIRHDLAPYDLIIESKPHHGIYVKGSERNKRRFILDYFFQERFFQTLHNYVDVTVFGREISLEELTIIVLDECREGQLWLSDFVIQNLVIHIALTVKRLTEGFQMAPIEELSSSQYPMERQVAEGIIKRVSQTTGLIFPEEEIDYITLHLISKAYYQKDREKGKELIREQLLAVLLHHPILSAYHFQQDFQLMEGVVAHLAMLQLRLQHHVHLDNPLSYEIESNYGAAFQMTQDVLEALPIFQGQSISKDEIAYVALHFMAALERLKEEKKYNVLVICATGFGSAQLLKNRVQHELGHLLHLVDVVGYYDLNDQILQGIDYIISSIDLSNLVFSIPVRTVSIFLSNEEVQLIKEDLENLHRSTSLVINTKKFESGGGKIQPLITIFQQIVG